MTDSMGDVVSAMRYHPYGEIAERYGQKPIYGFAGGEIEEEQALGLVRFGARWYAPDIGRWVSGDLLFVENPKINTENPLESSLYDYVSNSPLNNTDKTGKKKEGEKSQKSPCDSWECPKRPEELMDPRLAKFYNDVHKPIVEIVEKISHMSAEDFEKLLSDKNKLKALLGLGESKGYKNKDRDVVKEISDKTAKKLADEAVGKIKGDIIDMIFSKGVSRVVSVAGPFLDALKLGEKEIKNKKMNRDPEYRKKMMYYALLRAYAFGKQKNVYKANKLFNRYVYQTEQVKEVESDIRKRCIECQKGPAIEKSAGGS